MSAYPFATTKGTPPTSVATPPTQSASENSPFGVLADQQRAHAAPPKPPQKFPPTPEQRDILDTFATGADMVIIAGAGTGKTSTISMLADALYEQDRTARGVYLAFNKAIATEVKSKFFYGNVDASTIHSLAFRGARNLPHLAPLLDKIGGRNGAVPLRVSERPKVFGVPNGIIVLRDPDAPMHPDNNPMLHRVAGTTAVRAALDAITKWCQSADTEVLPKHVILKKNQVSEDARPQYRDAVAALARRIWDQDIMSPAGRLNFAHDYYLKAWTLTKPDICKQLGIRDRRAVLFFDEAQDSRPCITDLVMNQRGKMQIVLCGDSSQAIYRFTGCQDAMKGFKETENVTPLTLSKTFRFGTDIACVANQILSTIDGSDIRIIPDYRINSTVTGFTNDLPDAIICRNNSTVIENMLELLDSGKKVFCSANTQVIMDIANDYMRLVSGDRPRNGSMKQFSSVEAVSAYLRTRSAMESEALSTGNEELLDEIELDDALVSTLRAVRKFGAVNVIRGIRGLERTDKTADVVLSTIHKSKGQQWDSVHVAWDVSGISQAKNPLQIKDELMLLYVAVTRAKVRLSVHPSVRDTLGIVLPDPERDTPLTTDERARELSQLCYALDPLFPEEGISEIISTGVTENEVVKAIISAAEVFGSHGGSRLPAQLITEVGAREYLDALDVAEAGFPVSLFASMLAVRGITAHSVDVQEAVDAVSEDVS